MATAGVSIDDGIESGNSIEEIISGLEDTHEEWDIEVERVSEKIVVTANRKDFYQNGADESVVTLDHPAERGWEIIGIGSWKVRYESGVEAIDVLTTLTHAYESRRTIKQERPPSKVTKSYYEIEEILLDKLADRGIAHG